MYGGEENTNLNPIKNMSGILNVNEKPKTFLETLKGHATNLTDKASTLVNTNVDIKGTADSLINTLKGHATYLANTASDVVSTTTSNITGGGYYTQKRKFRKGTMQKRKFRKGTTKKRKFRKGTTKKRNFKK